MFLFLLGKVKSILLLFLNILRRAFCCFRRRRRQSKDEPLSHIVVNEGGNNDAEREQWNDWEFKNRKPASVEEHIEYYRQQQAKLRQQQEQQAEEAAQAAQDDLDLFQDMMPQITKQKKVVIGAGGQQETNHQDQEQRKYSLNMQATDGAAFVTNQLENWEDNSGWESEALDVDAGEILRQKKREERERRLFEQQQKRMERTSDKTNRPLLGSRLVT